MLSDFFKDLFDQNGGLPIPLTLCSGRIQHDPRNVIAARTRVASRGVFSKTRSAPRAQLSQRHGRTGTAGDVLHALDLAIGRLHLLPDKPRHISRMQAVAYLMSLSIKTNISKRLPSQIRVNPKDSLVGLAELTGTGKHPATIVAGSVERPLG
jgi:hypothetical protein